MKQTQYKRKQIFVDKNSQLRFVSIILFLLLINMIVGWTVYYTIWDIISNKVISQSNENRAFFSFIFDLTNSMLIIRGIFLFILTILISIYISHKIFGPVYRIKKTINDIGHGDLSKKIKLRKFDELKDLVEVINQMIQNQNELVSQQIFLINKISDIIIKMKNKEINNLDELEKTVNELQEIIKKYKV
ncbi:MAG: methyl-accepting chemotaxis protein [bacterium]